MKAKQQIKTNAMRILEKNNIPYTPLYYNLGKEVFSGVKVAEILNKPVEQSFKTLTLKGTKQPYLVFVIPVNCELDLKKAARAAGEKRVELVAVKDLLAITGYMRGEVSPIGMKKQFPTVLHNSAQAYKSIYISGGKKGCSMACNPQEIAGFLSAQFADIIL